MDWENTEFFNIAKLQTLLENSLKKSWHNPNKPVWNFVLKTLFLQFQYKPDADPALYINPEQPLIAATTISNEDIEKQENRVLEMRRKLAEAIEALYG